MVDINLDESHPDYIPDMDLFLRVYDFITFFRYYLGEYQCSADTSVLSCVAKFPDLGIGFKG